MTATFDKQKTVQRRFAVGIYLSGSSRGGIELKLDDLELEGGAPPRWKHWAFFTSLPLDEARMLSHELTDDEYAAIGRAVLARLVAFRALEE